MTPGMIPVVVMATPVADTSAFPDPFRKAMKRADRAVFFSRLGDQVRFNLSGDAARAVMTQAQQALLNALARRDIGI